MQVFHLIYHQNVSFIDMYVAWCTINNFVIVMNTANVHNSFVEHSWVLFFSLFGVFVNFFTMYQF